MIPNRKKWIESKKRQRKIEDAEFFLEVYLHQKRYLREFYYAKFGVNENISKDSDLRFSDDSIEGHIDLKF